jgi:hypothetical protein
MDASTDQYKSDDNHLSSPFLAVAQTFKDLVNWLVRFFTITEEERSRAGIYFGGEEHE